MVVKWLCGLVNRPFIHTLKDRVLTNSLKETFNLSFFCWNAIGIIGIHWAMGFLFSFGRFFRFTQLVQGWSSSQLPFKAPPEPKRRLADQDGLMANRIKITSYYQISLDNLRDSFYMPSGSFRPFVMHLVSEVSDGRHVSLRRPQHIEFKILKKP